MIARFPRELAIEVQAQYDDLRYGRLPRTALVIGGMAERPQLEADFSATLEASVAGLVNDYMRNPVRVALGSTISRTLSRMTGEVFS